MTDYLQATATILSLVNPVICAAIFSRIERDAASSVVGDASRAALAIAAILAAAALAGSTVLETFGVSTDAFQVAGGGVLGWMGFSMLQGPKSDTASGDPTSPAPGTPSLAPLILFAASPGTITGVITIAVGHRGSELPDTALIAIGVAVAATWLVMVVTARGSSKDRSQGLMQDLVPRFMGLLVLAMGVQFVLSGVRAFMAAG